MNYLRPVKIQTNDTKFKIQEGFESVIQIWTGCRQFSDPANLQEMIRIHILLNLKLKNN